MGKHLHPHTYRKLHHWGGVRKTPQPFGRWPKLSAIIPALFLRCRSGTLHVRTCKMVQTGFCPAPFAPVPITVCQVWVQTVQAFSTSGSDPCSCARAVAPQPWHMTPHFPVGAYPHAKFQHNRAGNCRVIVIRTNVTPVCTLHVQRVVTHMNQKYPMFSRRATATL